MIYDMEASGRRLKELRKQAGKTQEQIAEDLNLAVETISRIERGKRGCSVDMLLMLSEYYQTSVDYLLKVTDDLASEEAKIDMLFGGLESNKRRIILKIIKLIAELIK